MATSAACYSPTEMVLELRTNIPCSRITAVDILVGTRAELTSRTLPVTTTASCTGTGAAGSLGTLVLVPSGARDSQAGIQVTMGIDGHAPESCNGAVTPVGCIVARRYVTFRPHDSRTLPIDLSEDCIGVSCATDTTCTDGQCRTADIDVAGVPTCEGCGAADASAETGADGGASDGAAPDGDASLEPVALDVTSALSITLSGFAYSRSLDRFVQTVTITNTSASPIAGPLALVFDQLSSNATLDAPAGTTQVVPPLGSPWLAVDVGTDGVLSPSEAVPVAVRFANPSKAFINYERRVLGPGRR